MIEAALANEAEWSRSGRFWNGEEKILRLASEVAGVAAAASPDGQAGAAPRSCRIGLGRAPASRQMRCRRSSLRVPSRICPATQRPRIGAARREGLRRGRLDALLLQYLPGVAAPHRRGVALAFLSARAAGLDETTCLNLTEAALNVIDLPGTCRFVRASFERRGFGRGPRSGRATNESMWAGQIDRIGEDANSKILVATTKTGRPCGSMRRRPPMSRKWPSIVPFWRQLWPNKNFAHCC